MTTKYRNENPIGQQLGPIDFLLNSSSRAGLKKYVPIVGRARKFSGGVLAVLGLLAFLTWNAPASFCQEGLVSDREMLKAKSQVYSWPGGLLHLTIWHDGRTARFLLLKAAGQSPMIREFLKLDDSQIKIVDELPLLSGLDDAQDRGMEPAFDEELIDSNYYAFLSDDQKARLDALAIRQDGYASLLRQSVYQRLNLSNEAKKSIAKLFEDLRRDYIHERGRQNFASQRPKDYDYEEVWWQGSTTTYLNMQIVDTLSDTECKSLARFLNDFPIPIELQRELRNKCTLPGGVLSLINFSSEKK